MTGNGDLFLARVDPSDNDEVIQCQYRNILTNLTGWSPIHKLKVRGNNDTYHQYINTKKIVGFLLGLYIMKKYNI